MAEHEVVSHTYHEGENVYRLVIAERSPDPDDLEGEPRLINHQEVVFAGDDERWEGKSPKQVAAEQRRSVKAALERGRAQREASSSGKDLGGAGDAL